MCREQALLKSWEVNALLRDEFSRATKRVLCREDDFDPCQAYVLGVDIGGTKTITMASTLDGDIIAAGIRPTPKANGRPPAEVVILMIEGFLAQTGLRLDGLKGIGVGVPGAVDVERGCVFLAPNLGWMDPYPLRQPVEKRLGVPVAVDNDVNMAALGESVYGVAKGVSNFVFVAVGTGIGAAIVVNNHLYRGAHYCAGEIGYMALDEDCLQSTYTDHGYLELVASGNGIAKRAMQFGFAGGLNLSQGPGHCEELEAGKDVHAEAVFVAASEGDQVAGEVVRQATVGLSLALANIIALLDPELVVLGGGICRNKELVGLVGSNIRRLVPSRSIIVPSNLGQEAQAYGGIAAALEITTPGPSPSSTCLAQRAPR